MATAAQLKKLRKKYGLGEYKKKRKGHRAKRARDKALQREMQRRTREGRIPGTAQYRRRMRQPQNNKNYPRLNMFTL
jgi:hypothetical protein